MLGRQRQKDQEVRQLPAASDFDSKIATRTAHVYSNSQMIVAALLNVEVFLYNE